MWRTFWNFVKCPVTVPLSRGLQDRGRLDTTPKEQLNLDRLRRANAGKNEDQAGTVPYVGDAHHPVIVYDYTPTRSRVGPAKFPGRVQRLSAGRRLLGLRCLFQVATRHDGGRVLDARPEIFLQGVGIRRATHGTGAPSDRTPLCRGGARQDAVAVGGTKGSHCASGYRRGCSESSTSI